MLTKTKKIKLLVCISISILIVILIITFWVLFAPKPLINELPDEEITRVVRITNNEGAEETESELSQENISLFYDLIKDLKFKKRYNPLGIKSVIYDNVRYTITYDNYTVILSEHYLSVSNNGENVKSFQISSTQPNGLLAEIDKLFDE